MKLYLEKSVSFKYFVISSAVFYSIFLFLAALAKIIYPNESLAAIDRSVGYFEIIWAAVILVFHGKEKVWAGTALVFAAWAGYSSFWLVRGLPCSCIGRVIELPPGGAVVLDAVLFTIATIFFCKGSRPGAWKWVCFPSIVLFVFGIIFGAFVNKLVLEL